MSASLVARHNVRTVSMKSAVGTRATMPARPAAALAARHSNAGTRVQTPLTLQRNSVSNRGVAVRTECKVKGLKDLVDKIGQAEMTEGLIDFRVGHDVNVGVQVKEGNKTRVQDYKGVIIAIHKNGISSSITVRKTVQGVGVERVFPIHSPLCTFTDVTTGVPKVRRAKLYYLRKLSGKSARLKKKQQ